MSNIFSFLDANSTDKKLSVTGLIPSLTTLLTLVAVSSVLTFVPMAWAHTALQLSLYVSYFTYTFASVMAVSLFNFWFQRELSYYALGASPINYGDKFGEVCLDKMVNHLVQELNVMDGTEDPNHPNHLPMPRLTKFSSNEVKIGCVTGRNINHAALEFSDGALKEAISGFNQSELAAMIMAELHKIKNCRSVSDTTLGIISSLSQMLDSLMSSPNVFFKAIGYMAVPLKFIFFIHMSILRSHVFEAATAVVASGRGDDYLAALNRKGHASRTKKRSDSDYKISPAMAARNHPKRPAYETPWLDWSAQRIWFPNLLANFIDNCLRPIAGWVDSNEYLTDAKLNTSRVSSFFDICIRRGAFYLKEVISDKPSGTHLKDHVKDELKNNKLDKRFLQIADGDRYKPIDPLKRIRWRYKRASLKGDMSYEKLKSKGCRTVHLCKANDIRKACKTKIKAYLEGKGIVASHKQMKKILYPMVFSHHVQQTRVVIKPNESMGELKALLNLHHKKFKQKDLKDLYNTTAEQAPQFKPKQPAV